MKGKKLLAVMLAALMSASSVGVTAFADEVQTTGISTLAAGDPVSTTVAAIGEDSYATLAEAMASLASRTGDIVIKLSGTASYEYNAWADFTKGYEGGTITFEGADETKATVLNLHGKDTDATPIQNAKKLIFKNLTINKTNAGDEGSAPWNRHSINFLGEVEFENVAVNTTVAVSGDASFTKVDFTETNEQYCLFVLNSAKNVTVKDCTFTATNNGRGIKIADQYVDEANQNSVNLTVTGSKFTTAKKAAVLVTVNKGANIVVGDNDITGVAADSTYIVWVDEDRAANASKVVVKNSNGSISSSVKVENGDGVTYEALAEINGVKYISLKDAVENATNGQTVKILKDIEIDSLEHKDIVLNHNIKSDVYAKINADVTIDFNNHSLKFSDKFKQNADAGKSHVMFFIESGNVTVTGNGNVNAYVNGNTKSRVFHCGYGITLNIENGDFRACEYVLYNVGYTSRIYIKGGTLGFPEECTGNHHRFDYKGIVCCLHDYDNIFVTDGTFIGVDPRDNGSTVIDSSKYAVSRFGNKYKVIPASSVVATITDVNKKQNNVYSYKSLQDAYNGAENEDTIVLTKDIVLTKADIEADNRLVRATRTKEDLSKVTFDFDGHTISLAEDVKNATCEDYRVFNVWYSDFTLKNGTIDLTNAAGSNAFIAAVRAYNEAYVRFDINIIINPKASMLIQCNGQKAEFNGGTYTYLDDKYDNYPYVSKTNYKSILNTSSGCPFIFNGGTFVNFDPLCQAKLAHHTASGLGEGKVMTKDGGTFTVVNKEDYAATVTKTVICYRDYAVDATKDRAYAYTSFADAYAKAESGDTITLLKDVTSNGVVVPSNMNLTLDLGGKTYTIEKPTVGSAGTETNGFQLLKDSNVTIKNGTITSTEAKILIQNYSNLTLDSVTLDGSNLAGNKPYTLSNNNGNVLIKNSTIKGSDKGYAFDVCDFSTYAGANVTVENSTIDGLVEISNYNGGEMNSKLVCGENEYTEDGEYTQQGNTFVKKSQEPNMFEKLSVIVNMNPEQEETKIYYPVTVFAGIDSLNYKEVGFKIKAKNSENADWNKEITQSTKKVYTSMKATNSNGKVTTRKAADLGGAYMFGQKMRFDSANWNNSNTTIEVTPYAIKLDGTEITGKTTTLTDAIIKAKNSASALFKEEK